MDQAEFEKYLGKKHDADVLKDYNNTATKYYCTGVIGLDIASGIGGFPRGKMIEIFGPESGGKSLTALKAVETAQRLYGKPSMYLDLESATPLDWLETLGIDLNLLTFIQQDAGLTGEKVFDIIREAIRENIYAYIVVDSVAGLIPKAELEGSVQDNYVATQARVVSKGVKVLVPEFRHSETTVLFINQLRMMVGVMFGNPETTPGGKAIKFYSSQRYRVSKKSQSTKKEDGDIVGHSVKVKNVKNKLGPPFREAEFGLYFMKGVNDIANLHKIGIEYGVITTEGHTHTFKGVNEDKVEISLEERGKDKFRESLRTNKDAQRLIYKLILSQFFAGKICGVEQGKDEEV